MFSVDNAIAIKSVPCEHRTETMSLDRCAYMNIDSCYFRNPVEGKKFSQVAVSFRIHYVDVKVLSASLWLQRDSCSMDRCFKIPSSRYGNVLTFSNWRDYVRSALRSDLKSPSVVLNVAVPSGISEEKVFQRMQNVYDSAVFALNRERRKKVSPFWNIRSDDDEWYADGHLFSFIFKSFKISLPVLSLSSVEEELGLPWSACLIVEGDIACWRSLIETFSVASSLSGRPCLIPTVLWSRWVKTCDFAKETSRQKNFELAASSFRHHFRSQNSMVSPRSIISHCGSRWLNLGITSSSVSVSRGGNVTRDNSKPMVSQGFAPTDQLCSVSSSDFECCDGAILVHPSYEWIATPINIAASGYTHFTYLCLEQSTCPDMLANYAIPLRYSFHFSSPKLRIMDDTFFILKAPTQDEVVLAKALSQSHRPYEDEQVVLNGGTTDYLVASHSRVDMAVASHMRMPVEAFAVQRALGIFLRVMCVDGFDPCLPKSILFSCPWIIRQHALLMMALFGEKFIGLQFHPRLRNVNGKVILDAVESSLNFSNSLSTSFPITPCTIETIDRANPEKNECVVKDYITFQLSLRLRERFGIRDFQVPVCCGPSSSLSRLSVESMEQSSDLLDTSFVHFCHTIENWISRGFKIEFNKPDPILIQVSSVPVQFTSSTPVQGNLAMLNNNFIFNRRPKRF